MTWIPAAAPYRTMIKVSIAFCFNTHFRFRIALDNIVMDADVYLLTGVADACIRQSQSKDWIAFSNSISADRTSAWSGVDGAVSFADRAIAISDSIGLIKLIEYYRIVMERAHTLARPAMISWDAGKSRRNAGKCYASDVGPKRMLRMPMRPLTLLLVEWSLSFDLCL